jgi:hypothetical protein
VDPAVCHHGTAAGHQRDTPSGALQSTLILVVWIIFWLGGTFGGAVLQAGLKRGASILVTAGTSPPLAATRQTSTMGPRRRPPAIAAIDLFVVPTLTFFERLFAFLVLGQGRPGEGRTRNYPPRIRQS